MKVKIKMFLDTVAAILNLFVACFPDNSLFMRIIGASLAFLFSWNIYDDYRELKKLKENG